MKRSLHKLAAVVFGLAQIVAACQGTETGNPGVPSDNPGGGTGTGGETCLVAKSQASDLVVDDLIAALCNKIVLCGIPTTIDTCFNALNGTDGNHMTDELGLPEGEFTIEELREALNAGEISASSAGASACETAIGAIDCETMAANVAPPDFSGTENVVPDACVSVFLAGDADGAPSSGGCP